MKKAKRLLSLLLSAAMVASMVPLTAHAAEKHSMKIAYVTPSEELQGAIDGGFYDLDVADSLGLNDRATALDDVKANYNLVNAAVTNPQYGTEGEPIEVNMGETFYLSFDLNFAQPDQGGFIGGVAGVIEAPEGVLTSGSIYVSPALLGSASGRWSYAEEGKNYYPGKTAFAGEVSAAQPGKNESNPGGKTDRFAVQFKNGTGYIPNEATWDAIVSFTANKPGTYEITVPTDTAEKNENMQPGAAYGSTTCSLSGWDGTGSPNNPSADASVLLGDFESNSVWIKVIGPELTLDTASITQEDGQKVTVNLANATFEEAATETGNWEITESPATSATVPTVFSVEKKSDTQCVLTLNASGATPAVNYTVTAKNAAVSADADLTTTGTFTVQAALGGTANVSGTATWGSELTAALAGGATSSGLHYQWMSGDQEVGTDAATYTTVKEDVGKEISCVITADDYVGQAAKGTTVTVTKQDAPQPSELTVASATYGDELTAADGEITTHYATEVAQYGALTFENADDTVLKIVDGKVYVAKGTDSGTVDVKFAGNEYYNASQTARTVTLTTANKKALTLSATEADASNGVAFTSLPVLEGAVTTSGIDVVAPTLKLEIGTKDNVKTTPDSGEVTDTITVELVDAGKAGSVVLNASVDSIASNEYYTFDPATFTLNVSAKPQTTLKLAGAGTPAFTFTPGAVENGTSEEITIGTPSDGKTYKITGVSADKGTVTWTEGNTFTYEAAASDSNETANITVEYVEVVNVTLSSTAKTYDGTTAVPAENITNDKGLTLTFNAKYDSADFGTGKEITIENIVVTNPAANTEYTFTGDDGTGVVTINDGEITKASVTDLYADAGTVESKDATLDTVKATLNALKVSLDFGGVKYEQAETISALVTDATLATAIQGIDGVEEIPAEAPADVTATIDSATSTDAAQKIGGKILLTVAADATAVAVKDSTSLPTGITLGGDAENGWYLAIDETASVADDQSVQLTVTTGTDPYDATVLVDVSAADASTYDFSNVSGSVTLDLDVDNTFTATNFTEDVAGAKVHVTINFHKQTSGGGGGIVGNLVSYEVGENGTIVEGSSSEYVNTGDKPAAVPTVDAKAGYTFMGWSLDKETYVDPATVVINENTTFYAMYQKGYINGYEDGLFYPARNVTRAEFTKMLVMATGLYNGGKTYAATDLKDDKGAWYTNYIACAVEAGIVDGYEDGNFYPDRTITRQEAAKMVFVAMGDVTEVTTTDKITDFDTVSNWAKTYVASLVEADLIAGYEDGTFQPKRLISRAETATMIDRIAGFDPTDEEKAEIASTIAPTFEDVTPDSWAFAYIMFGAGELDDSYYA
jgi:uncharacterized repeat protein (TIGR02543 family)